MEALMFIVILFYMAPITYYSVVKQDEEPDDKFFSTNLTDETFMYTELFMGEETIYVAKSMTHAR